MLKQFIQNVENKALFLAEQKILLAVSGGIDSMVLLHLFEESGMEYGVVHCNFKLRGEDSDRDEAFVKKQVLVHGVPAFFESFETREYAAINGISIEMAARELRYEYFERIRSENGFDYIATAHHQDDLIETFFLNLTRKTGIKGLTGIKEKSGTLIRPLLFAARSEIEKYAKNVYLEFREDQSNTEVVYQRNFLRHKVIPLFRELNPAFHKNILASVENLKDAEKVYNAVFSKEKEVVMSFENHDQVIDIEKLLASRFPKILLLELLSTYNFNSVVIDEVYQSLKTGSGKQFFSKTHRVIKDREKLFISPNKAKEEKIYYIERDDMELFTPMDITIETVKSENFQLIKKRNVACIDKDKIQFPLLIRTWQQGDYFQPLGMSGLKKVSDFFIDQKIPLHKKENTWILCSGRKIVWIMGHRLDDRFKITPDSKEILKIEIQ